MGSLEAANKQVVEQYWEALVGEIGQQIGHTHDMVKIGAGVAFWFAWGQAKKIFGTEGDAHKEVIFELGDRDKLIHIDRGFGQHIFLKHQPTARHASPFCRAVWCHRQNARQNHERFRQR